MTTDINIILENLQKNLNDINSAKEQVSETIKAYGAVGDKIDGYVNSIGNIAKSLTDIIALLNSKRGGLIAESESVISRFKGSTEEIEKGIESSLGAIKKSFAEDTQKEIAELSKINNELALRINDFKVLIDTFTSKQKEYELKLEKSCSDIQAVLNGAQENFDKALVQNQTVLEKLQKRIQINSILNIITLVSILCGILIVALR